jgi:hypothetical protein
MRNCDNFDKKILSANKQTGFEKNRFTNFRKVIFYSHKRLVRPILLRYEVVGCI